MTVALTVWDHNTYYQSARETYINITGDRRSGRLLGAQIVGYYNSEVSKRIDVVAAALFDGLQVENLFLI